MLLPLIKHPLSQKLLWFACVATLCACLFAIFLKFAYGFDVTDEGFYLVTVDSPLNYRQSLSQFGFVLQPLWLLSGENVYQYRLLFWGILFAAVFAVFSILLSRIRMHSKRVALAMGLSFSLFAYMGLWLPTPSYNSVALLGVLLAITVVLKLGTVEQSTVSVLSISLPIALIGVLTFLVKPTASIGIALTIAIICFYRYFERHDQRYLWILGCSLAIFLFFLGVTAYVISGSPLSFYGDMSVGFEHASSLLGQGFSSTAELAWKGSLNRAFVSLDILIGITIFTLLLVVECFNTHLQTKYKAVLTFSRILLFVFLLFGLAAALGVHAFVVDAEIIEITKQETALVFWVPLLSLTILCTLQSTLNPIGTLKIVPFLVLLLAYSYVFGTSNNYIEIFRLVPVIGFVAAVMAVSNGKNSYLLVALSMFGVLVGLLSLPYQGKELYRQPSIASAYPAFADSDDADHRFRGLKMSPELQNYYKSAIAKARLAGFTPGTPVIDLTGASSGLLFAIDGEAVGAAWLLGGYAGSDDFARTKLSASDPIKTEQAWVLIENSTKSISPSVLRVIQKDLNTDYTAVANFTIPKGYGARRNAAIQTLYRPIK